MQHPLMVDWHDQITQYIPLPAETMFVQEGVRIFTRKFSMRDGINENPGTNSIANDLAIVRAVGGLVMGYHWCDPADPRWHWATQAEHFLRAVEKYKPNGIAFDIEQHWASWPKYWAGTLDPKKDVLSGQQILDHTVWTVEYVRQRCDLPYLLYTGRWFTLSYCPKLGSWIADQPTWLADYPDYSFRYPVGTTARKAYPIGVGPTAGYIRVAAFADSLNATAQLAVPTGCTNVKAWQFSPRIIAQGLRIGYDWSRWIGDEADLRSFFHLDPPPALPYWKDLTAKGKDSILQSMAEDAGKVAKE